MKEPIETILSRSLRAYRAALYRLEPSADLDARFDQSLEAWRADRAQEARGWRRSRTLAAAAAVILAASAGWLAMYARTREPVSAAMRNVDSASSDTAVVRVEASLGTPLPVGARAAFDGEPRHYWVDVGIAGDGSLYIEGVMPADDDPELFIP
jgi:hypothetical protein